MSLIIKPKSVSKTLIFSYFEEKYYFLEDFIAIPKQIRRLI